MPFEKVRVKRHGAAASTVSQSALGKNRCYFAALLPFRRLERARCPAGGRVVWGGTSGQQRRHGRLRRILVRLRTVYAEEEINALGT